MQGITNGYMIADIYSMKTRDVKHYILNGSSVDQQIDRHIEMYGDDIEDLVIQFRLVPKDRVQ